MTIAARFPPPRNTGDWADDADCKGQTDIFYSRRTQELAVAICQTCPVLNQCRQHRRDHNETRGVWAGIPERAKTRAIPPTVRFRQRGARRLAARGHTADEIAQLYRLDAHTIRRWLEAS